MATRPAQNFRSIALAGLRALIRTETLVGIGIIAGWSLHNFLNAASPGAMNLARALLGRIV